RVEPLLPLQRLVFVDLQHLEFPLSYASIPPVPHERNDQAREIPALFHTSAQLIKVVLAIRLLCEILGVYCPLVENLPDSGFGDRLKKFQGLRRKVQFIKAWPFAAVAERNSCC